MVHLPGLEPDEALAMLRQYAANSGMTFVDEVSDADLRALPRADEALSQCIRLSLLETEYDRRRVVIHPMTRSFARSQLKERPEFKAQSKQRCITYYHELVKNAVIRKEPRRRYWNALVSDAMLKPEARS